MRERSVVQRRDLLADEVAYVEERRADETVGLVFFLELERKRFLVDVKTSREEQQVSKCLRRGSMASAPPHAYRSSGGILKKWHSSSVLSNDARSISEESGFASAACSMLSGSHWRWSVNKPLISGNRSSHYML